MLSAALELGAREQTTTLLGSRFTRDPPDATMRYANWANALPQSRLRLECFREVTLLQPTWFFHRALWRSCGGYDEGVRLCDDLHFFYRHVLEQKGGLLRVDESLVVYRHLPGTLTSKTSRKELVRVRCCAFAKHVLPKWPRFSIWGAGRDARDFVNALCQLDATMAQRVVALHDVDAAKVDAGTYHNGKTGRTWAVKSVACIKSPFVCCVALDRYVEHGIDLVRKRVVDHATSKGLVEGQDYWHFN